jgi:hypothetical protein
MFSYILFPALGLYIVPWGSLSTTKAFTSPRSPRLQHRSPILRAVEEVQSRKRDGGMFPASAERRHEFLSGFGRVGMNEARKNDGRLFSASSLIIFPSNRYSN